MKCPQCGYEIGSGAYKCLRCGYECKGLASSAGEESEEREKHEPETFEIDPSDVSIQKERKKRRGIMDDIFGGDGLFGGLFGDIFGGLFGDVFEEDDDYYEDGRPQAYDDFGQPIPFDVFDRDFVEIHDVEIVEEEEKGKRKRRRDNGKKDK